ncbi:MAG: prephenate dehydrogenase [Panacagrimonas sp.]
MRRVSLIGLGLIGASLAKALKRADASLQLTAFDTDPAQLKLAVEQGMIDCAAQNAATAVRQADIVIFAVPVRRTSEALQSARSGLPADAVLTDVGSTKQSVLADVKAVFGEIPPNFVAAHPIAGTEKSGAAAAMANLFEKHRVIITPHENQSASAAELVRRMWQSTGARVVEMPADRHDAIFAATSHLPHVLAYAFVDMLTRLESADLIFSNAGGGFRDFTRIASSSPHMWHDIVRANRDQVCKVLEQQIGELQAMLALMKDGQWDQLEQWFQRARDTREKYLQQIE